MRSSLIIAVALIALVGLSLAGCASPGSPEVTIEKNQYVENHFWPADATASADVADTVVEETPEVRTVQGYPVYVTTSYEQTSDTGIESAIEQQLQDLLKADIEALPLP